MIYIIYTINKKIALWRIETNEGKTSKIMVIKILIKIEMI